MGTRRPRRNGAQVVALVVLVAVVGPAVSLADRSESSRRYALSDAVLPDGGGPLYGAEDFVAPLPPRAAVEEARRERSRQRERRAKPEAREARQRSRREHAGVGRSEAVRVLREAHREVTDAPLWEPLRLRPGQKVAAWLGSRAARIDGGPGHRDVLVESALPLRVKNGGDGEWAAIDLALDDRGVYFRSGNPLVAVRYAKRVDDGLLFERSGIRLRPTGGEPASEASVVDGRTFYPDGGGVDTDVYVQPNPTGAQVMWQLRSDQAPEALRLAVDLPAGMGLRMGRGGIVEIVAGEKVIATVDAPHSWDADGEIVPTVQSIEGDSIVVRADHRGGDWRYPILVDPTVDERMLDPSTNLNWDTWPWLDWNGWGAFSSVWQPYGPNAFNTGPYNFNTQYYEGRGLYLYHMHQSGTLNQWDSAYLTFVAPGTSYITRAEFYSQFNTQPGIGACVALGLLNPDGAYDGGRWDTPTQQWYHEAPFTDCDPYTLGSTWGYQVHCSGSEARGQVPCGDQYGTPGNRATLTLLSTAREDWPWHAAYMRGARLYLSDRDLPRYTSVTHTNLPAGWVENVTDAVTPTVTDDGLGEKTMWFKVDPADGSGMREWEPWRMHPCWGDRNDRCPSSWHPDPTKRSWTQTYNYNTNSLPEGINWFYLQAGDIVWNVTPTTTNNGAGWPIKIDRSAPSVALSGQLYDDRNVTDEQGFTDYGDVTSPATLTVSATDGTPSAPRSGVASIEMRIDGSILHSSHRYDASCNQTGCPSPLARDFTFDPADVSEGDHTVTVIVRDQLANSSSVTAGTHVKTESFVVHVGDGTTTTHSTPPQPGPDDPSPPEDTSSSPYVNDLTAGQLVQAQTIVHTTALDPLSRLHGVVGLSPYSIDRVGPLTAGFDVGSGKLRTIGATAHVVLQVPHSADAVVEDIAPPLAGASGDYTPFLRRLVSPNVVDLEVLVDFSSQKVIAVEPGAESDVTSYHPLPGQTLPPPPDPED